MVSRPHRSVPVTTPQRIAISRSSLGGQAQAAALSSDQIINILEQNPDLAAELKSQLADRMQQQGAQIDPNDISDQMLYGQISTNARLRAEITTVLRARGLVTDDDLQSVGSSAAGGDSLDSLSMEQPSLSPTRRRSSIGYRCRRSNETSGDIL